MLKTRQVNTRVNLQNRERPPSFTALTIKVGTLTSEDDLQSCFGDGQQKSCSSYSCGYSSEFSSDSPISLNGSLNTNTNQYKKLIYSERFLAN